MTGDKVEPSNTRIRVWDKKNKEWLDPSHMEFNSTGDIVFKGGAGTLTQDDLIICRSTGCVDWDEKEIFEGDIVTTGIADSSSPNGEWRAIVRWHKDQLMWWIGDDHEMSGELERYVDTPSQKAYPPCRIIGNIYENPKLGRKL